MKMVFYSSILPFFLLATSCSEKKSDNQKELYMDSVQTRIVGEEVTYEADSIAMNGYLAYDNGSDEKRPGILVVHEWWGHNDYARQRAEMLAELGYIALAVDMYGDGKKAEHPDDAGAFAGKVMGDIEGARERFAAAMEVLKSNPKVDSSKIGAIGYCFGGGIVLHMARFGLDLKGVVSFHGSLGTKFPAKPGTVKASILVLNGAEDPFVPAEAIETFKKEMEAAGVDMEFVAYEGAIHAFTNPSADDLGKKFNLPLAYNESADTQSWAKMTEFFVEIFK
ncbi:MAG: dienelactone hydrolase family protein [Cyclobacteriaceae bacterium]|nr:dienelactone hydrolase family protein [Cyclobacteriaceae bacterium]